MKAEELRALIREVLAEQDDKMKLTGSKTPQALKAEILDTIKNIDLNVIKSQELMFLNQMIDKMFQMAAERDLVRGKTVIQRGFELMNKGIPKEEPEQTNEGHQMIGGIEDDGH